MTTSSVSMRRATAGLTRMWASPFAVSALAVGAAAIAALAGAVSELRESRALRHEAHRIAATIAAEESALAYVQSDGLRDRRAVDAGNGLVVETYVHEEKSSQRLRLCATVAEHRYDFVFQRLVGGTPPSFGHAFTIAPGASAPADWLSIASREELPAFAAIPPSTRDALLGVVAADPGLALLRLAAGTDRPDFVLAAGKARNALAVPASGLVRIDGNLWLDSGDEPLELSIPSDLTIVVHGNAYLGRSVRVAGPGRLTIATVADGATSFSDLDGNGRYAAGEPLHGASAFRGPLEGGGNVYVGMPREVADSIELEFGVVCGGAFHIAANAVTVHGPLMIGAAGVPIGGRNVQLLATGLRLPSMRRTAVPGFAAVGSPRPTTLTAVPGDLPLYSASPAR